MIPPLFRIPLLVQLFYAALVITWQLVGATLILLGRPAPGPTASYSIAAQATVVAALFVVTLRRSPAFFTLLSLGVAFAPFSSVHHSMTADPALWSSEGTRWLSIAINSVGLFAATLVVIAFFRWLPSGVAAWRAKRTTSRAIASEKPPDA